MLRLAAGTGARRGELCALRWPDVDLRTGLVLIRRSPVVGQEFELVEKPTKTHAERRFNLDAGTIREVGCASPPKWRNGPSQVVTRLDE
jgi:integrase